MFAFLAWVAFFAYAATACYTDLRWRIVPNLLNYSALATAILLVTGAALFEGAAIDALAYAFFVAAAFLFAYLLYRAGAWAGGDAKFFTGLLAFAPLLSPYYAKGLAFIVWAFLNAALVLIPVTALVYFSTIAHQRSLLARLAAESVRGAALAALSFVPLAVLFSIAVSTQTAVLTANPLLQVVLFALFLAASFFLHLPLPLAGALALVALYLQPGLTLAGFAALLPLAFLARLLLAYFPHFSQAALRKTKRLDELEEGDVPADTWVLRKGRAVVLSRPTLGAVLAFARRGDIQGLRELLQPSSPVLASARRARGLTRDEIQALKRAGGVERLIVRESLPFAPVLAAGFLLATLWWMLG